MASDPAVAAVDGMAADEPAGAVELAQEAANSAQAAAMATSSTVLWRREARGARSVRAITSLTRLRARSGSPRWKQVQVIRRPA